MPCASGWTGLGIREKGLVIGQGTLDVQGCWRVGAEALGRDPTLSVQPGPCAFQTLNLLPLCKSGVEILEPASQGRMAMLCGSYANSVVLGV